MTQDTREGDSEAQKPAETALPFDVYSQHERFVDELALTPHAYRTLAELGLTMIPILHEDEDVAQWLDAADDAVTSLRSELHEWAAIIVRAPGMVAPADVAWKLRQIAGPVGQVRS